MTLEEVKTIAKRGLLEGVGKPDMAAIDELFSPELAEAVKEGSAFWHSISSNLEYAVEQIVAEGDTAFVRWSSVETHTGVFWGIAPTGKTTKGTGILICRVANGKIVQWDGVWDALGALIDLGAIPPMIAEGYRATQAETPG